MYRMRVVTVAFIALISTLQGCEKEAPEKAREAAPRPGVALPPFVPPSPCPKAAAPDGAKRLGDVSEKPIVVKAGLVWLEGKKIWFFSDDADKPRAIDEVELQLLHPKPERHLKRQCGSGGCGEHGDNVDLVLVEGSGQRVIAKNRSEIEAAELVGDAAVWAEFGPYAISGGVYRAAITGGHPEQLWKGAVHTMLVDKKDVYAAGESGVAWIDLESGKAVVLDAESRETDALAVTGDRLFWSDERLQHDGGKPSGRIMSAPRHGGAVTTHASQQPSPEAVAVDNERVFWGSSEKGGVWSTPITGGPVTEVVPTVSGCGGVRWLHRTARGLLFLHSHFNPLDFSAGGEMWFASFSK